MKREKRGISLTAQRREARMENYGAEISPQAYNAILGGSVFYGLVLNFILAYTAYPLVQNINPIIFLICYIVLVIAGTAMSGRSKNPFISFIGYNMICVPIGLMLSIWLPGVAFGTVLMAILLTAVITLLISIAAAAMPQMFEQMGKGLFIALVCILAIELLALIIGFPIGWIDGVAAGVFALYIGYDYVIAQRYPKTADNAVDCSIDIYLDVINLFIRIVDLLDND